MQKIKKYIPLVVWILVGVTCITCLAFIEHDSAKLRCKGVSIEITDAALLSFVEENDIKRMVNESAHAPLDKLMSDINTAMLENIIYTNPYINKAEVLSTLDGKVVITASQRVPILHISCKSGENFFFDTMGVVMPVHKKFAVNVLCANGNIPCLSSGTELQPMPESIMDTAREASIHQQLYYIARYVSNHPFWSAQLGQVYVTENYEIELIPRIGDHIIKLGSATHLKEKLDKLFVFYKNGLNKKGWTDYESLDLTYQSQVVCVKKKKREIPTDTATVTKQTTNSIQ
ncbi:MAG: hypothetical protein IPO27_01620 [Bacteroidetes bacterium]|nr:hypothetical protein [Bacteroidota bacterium]